ncbi:MAG: PHP domain-containing protein [Eubacteriales bacterium]
MKLTCDYHTHTHHSDGSGTVEQNVLAAIKLGFSAIAISDHSVRHAVNGVRNVDRYLADIQKVRDAYKGIIDVRSALELNLLSLEGELDIPRGYEKSFDLLLFEFHKAALYRGAASAMHFLLPKSVDAKAIGLNTRAYIAAIEQFPVNVITHIGYGLPVDKLEIAQAAKKHGILLEINNKHPEFTVAELTACQQTGVQFILGSDAHAPENIGKVENAFKKAMEAKLPLSSIFNAKE